MTAQQSLEGLVAAWMDEDAALAADREFIDRVLVTTARRRPWPRRLSMVVQSPMRLQARVVVGSATQRLAVVAALLILALVAVAAVGALLLRPTPPPDDWLGFRGGPGHDGVALTGPVGQPVVRWTQPLGAPVKNNIVIKGDLVVVPTEDGALHALDIATGTVRWTYRPGTSLTGPVASGDLVYVTDGGGILQALETATGTVRWRATHRVTGASAGIVAGDAVLVGTSDGHVVAFDAASGALRWDVVVSLAGAVLGSPAYDDGLIYTASRDAGLVALREASGEVAWRLDTGGDPVGTPVVAGGVAYIGAQVDEPGGRLRAVDAATGLLRWPADEPLLSPSVVGSLAISGSSNGVVSARDVATGSEVWRFESLGVIRPPAVAGGIAYFAADGVRQILALDAATGRFHWQFDIGGENQCCVAVARGLVLAGTMDGIVYAIGGDGVATIPGTPPPTASSAPSATPSVEPSVPATPLQDPLTVTRRLDATDLGMGEPLGLAIAPSGEIYVTDLSDRVTRLDPTGAVIGSWGGTGSGPGQFDFTPASTSENVHGSIGVGPDGSVYVSDFDNHRVQVFTADGVFIRQFGEIGTGPGQFSIPFDLNADADGNVYVLDDGARNLTKFSPTGEVIWIVDASTSELLDGHGHSVAFDTQGRVVLAIDDNSKVVYLDPGDGTVVDSFDALGCDVAVHRTGYIFVSDCEDQRVTIFDDRHRPIGTNTIGIGLLRFGPGNQGVGLGPDRSILFLEVSLPST